jgi:hypothetical protein
MKRSVLITKMRLFSLYLASINAKWNQRFPQIMSISGRVNREGVFMRFTDIADNATLNRAGLAFPA